MTEDDKYFNSLDFSELRNKYEILELKYHKSEIENTKKNKEIERLQEEIQKFRKITNDASTDYPWPEEFCERWKKLFESTIMDSFDNIFYKNILLVRVINITVKIVYDIAKEKIIEKIIEILNCFGIENKNNDFIKVFFKKFQNNIFQDYFKTIIKFDDILLKKILLNIRLEIGTQKGKLFSDLEIEEINKDLDCNQIKHFIQELFILSLYMHFHDPHLSIKTSTDLNYSYFSKKDFISLDGFGNENSVCLIILNPPLLKLNTFFKKLVPIVFICENPNEEMIKQCELKKFYQFRKLQSKSFNIIDTPSVFNLQNQINEEKKNNIDNDKKDKLNNNSIIDKHNNIISNVNSLINENFNYSNRNNKEKTKNYDKKKKNYVRSKSSVKNFQNNLMKNQEQIFKNKQQNLKQINSIMANESSISQNENNNYYLNQNMKEKNIFNIINNKQLQANNLKKEKSFTISAEINQEEQNSNILRLNREIELRNIKNKLSREKLENKSRNNSTFEFENNNNSNKQKEENLEVYPLKLITEIHNRYSPKNNLNFIQTPIQKKRTNSIVFHSEKSEITENLKFISQNPLINTNNIMNQKQIKTTIKKINNNGNSYLRKTLSTIEQSNNNNNNINNNINNNTKKINLCNMDISGNNNYESISYRSTHNLIRNNSHSNDNKIHNISTNSICSNHGNSELKMAFSKNNYININKQNNNIIKYDYYQNNNNLNKEGLSNIVFNSKKGFDYNNNQHIKTDYDNYLNNNTLESHPIKNEENSTINSNRIGYSNIKNTYFSTNDIKSMKFFHKNEIQKKGSKTLIGKKSDNQINFENQNYRVKSPLKNAINNKNNVNGFTKSPKINNNNNNTSIYNNGNNNFQKEKKYHQYNKYKKK